MQQLIKSNHMGDPLLAIVITAYSADKKLCVVSTMREYISRTKKIRKSDQLVISYIKPFESCLQRHCGQMDDAFFEFSRSRYK